jgi:MFS family permease
LLTFAIAFIARPLGSLLFGHFGDSMGRKTTLVVSLLLMGCRHVSDRLPADILAVGRARGRGAVPVQVRPRHRTGRRMVRRGAGRHGERACRRRRALYGSFPELGAPIGFFLSNGTFFVLEMFCTPQQMLSWGWRVPFLLSAVLVSSV